MSTVYSPPVCGLAHKGKITAEVVPCANPAHSPDTAETKATDVGKSRVGGEGRLLEIDCATAVQLRLCGTLVRCILY